MSSASTVAARAHPAPPRPARNARATSAAVLAAGFGLAVAGSGRPSLWTDEAATISAASRSWPELWAMAHQVDAVHSAYYAFMHLWLAVLPPEQTLLRLPSAVATGLTALVLLWLGRRLADPLTAVLGAGVFVVLPRTTWMGMEARPYAFSALLAVTATWALVVLTGPGTRPRRPGLVLVGYGLVAALGVAVNLYVALLLLAHGVSLLLTRRTTGPLRLPLLRWLVAGCAAVLLAGPVVWLALHQRGQLSGAPLQPFGWLRDVVVGQWFLGETPTPSTGGAAWSWSMASSWQPAAVALALVCWLLVLRGVAAASDSRALLRWALPWAVLPVLVVALYSFTVANVHNARYFSFAAPAVALLVGHGLVHLGRGWRRWGAAVLVVLLALPVYLSQRTLHAKNGSDWSAAAAFVAAHARPGDAVYFTPRYPVTSELVGRTTRGVRTAYPAAFDGLRDVTLLRTPVQDDNLTGTSRLLQDSVSELVGVRTVWVVRRVDYGYQVQDDRTLAGLGFRPERQWTGPLDQVIGFGRP